MRRGHDGAYDSILGRRVDRVLATTIHFRPEYFDVASGDVRLHATLVEVDTQGRAQSIERLRITEPDLAELS